MFSSRIVEALREMYPVGKRIVLVQMDDIQAPPEGTRGTVKGVDDVGSIMVEWDNGSSLNVAYGEDIVRPLTKKEFAEEELANLTFMQYEDGDYVLTPIKNAFNPRTSYWISKKGCTVALYCFTPSDFKDLARNTSPDAIRSYESMFDQERLLLAEARGKATSPWGNI